MPLARTLIFGGCVALGCATLAVSCGGTAIGNATADLLGGTATAAAVSSSPPTTFQKNFPPQDYLQQIPNAYRIAHQHPLVLEKTPCYCPCELYGHGGLIDCYRSQHAAQCATCLEEAIMVGELIEQQRDSGATIEPMVTSEQVKSRYRAAIVRSAMNEMPEASSPMGQAYLRVCSECHQPPHPAMYTPDEWRAPLSRMQAYARQRNMEPDPGTWELAIKYARTMSSRYDPRVGRNYRQQLAAVVERLKADEGNSAYYPSAQDAVLDPTWFDRMVQAYRLARDLPVALLAETKTDDPTCLAVGHDNLLACLNSNHAVTSEPTVASVEKLAKAG